MLQIKCLVIIQQHFEKQKTIQIDSYLLIIKCERVNFRVVFLRTWLYVSLSHPLKRRIDTTNAHRKRIFNSLINSNSTKFVAQLVKTPFSLFWYNALELVFDVYQKVFQIENVFPMFSIWHNLCRYEDTIIFRMCTKWMCLKFSGDLLLTHHTYVNGN